jgi:hypothetical protein
VEQATKTEEIGFWRHNWMAIKYSFSEFGIVRDMVIGTTIAVITLAIQVQEHLIPLADWQEHKKWWILSFVLPYIVILGGHAIWRLLKAPWLLYRKTEREHAEEISKLNDKHEKEIAAAREVKQCSPQKLAVHSAIYGTGEMSDVSVLSAINNMTRDALVIPVDNNLVRGKDDPAPNQPKRLLVEYSYGDSPKRTVQRPESRPGCPSRLVLPEDSELLRLTQDLNIVKSAAVSATEAQRRLEDALSEGESRHREELAALKNKIEKETRDWAGDWKELATQFRELTEVMANWSRTTAGEYWNLVGNRDAVRRIDSLRKHAGDLLVASPNVSQGLSAELPTYPAADRWLFYLKAATGQFQTTGFGSEQLQTGGTFTCLIGSIVDLGEVSANACMECASQEY